MNATSQARRSGMRLQLALLIGAIALVLIHLSLTYALLGELDSRLIVLDGGIAIIGLAVAFWYVGSLVEERQRHNLEGVLMEVLTVPSDIADTAQAALTVFVREGIAEAATIAVADDTDSAMHPIAARGYPDTWIASADAERLPDATERPSVVREREPHRWVEPVAERIARHPWVARVPLFSGDDPIGLLLLTAARPGALRDHRLLDTLGVQLSAALDHAAMYEAAYQRERDLEEQDFRRLEMMAAISDDIATTPAIDPAATDDLAAVLASDPGISGEELEEHIESPIQGVDRLNVLIDDLMDLGRTGFEYAVEPEEVDVVDVVRRMSEGLRPAMQQRDLTLTDEMPRRPIVTVTDAMLVEKVILNVLSNATRHAPVGGGVTLFARRTGDGRARVEIHDDGARIDAEDRERIFEPYYRVRRSDASPVPGAGLGLAVARRIVDTLDGRIWVDERDEQGARICIEIPGVLPLVSTAAAPSEDTATAAAPAAPAEEQATPAAPFESEPSQDDPAPSAPDPVTPHSAADDVEKLPAFPPPPHAIPPTDARPFVAPPFEAGPQRVSLEAPAPPAPGPARDPVRSGLMPFAPEFEVDDSELQLLEVPPEPEPSVGEWPETAAPMRAEDAPFAALDAAPYGGGPEALDAPEFTDADAPPHLDADGETFPPLADPGEPSRFATRDERDQAQAPPEDDVDAEAPRPWATPGSPR